MREEYPVAADGDEEVRRTKLPAASGLSLLQIGCFSILGLIAVGTVILVAVIYYGLSSGRLSQSKALPKGKIPAAQLREISAIIDLRPNEEVLYFYSASLVPSEDGNLFTNERVISYTSDEGGRQVFEASYDEVESISLIRSNSWVEDSTLNVLLKDGTTLTLWVSNEENGDQQFHDRLKEQIEFHRKRPKVEGEPEAQQQDAPSNGRSE